MLFLKRSLTAFALFIILFFVFAFGAMATLGAIVGAGAAAKDPKARDFQSGYAAGHAAGYEVGKRYGSLILLGAMATSALSSIAISFSGILPWCRKPPQPPPLPLA